jgi:uncharacterized membrane protein YdjX (TVP38/TMEM64 family)
MTATQEPRTGSEKSQITRDIGKILLVTLIFAVLAFLFESETVRAYFDIETWREVLQEAEIAGGRINGAILFVLAGGVGISLGIPRIWFAALSGAVYGAVLGSSLALLAAVIGATVLYRVGSVTLKEVVNRRVGGRVQTWRDRFRENGFWWVLYARLFPFSNATLTSLLCGSCHVPFGSYLAASVIGFIPLTLVFAAFGSGGAKANHGQIALGFGLLLLVFLSRRFLRRLMPVRPSGQTDASRSSADAGVAVDDTQDAPVASPRSQEDQRS